jgi:hypothetical protein
MVCRLSSGAGVLSRTWRRFWRGRGGSRPLWTIVVIHTRRRRACPEGLPGKGKRGGLQGVKEFDRDVGYLHEGNDDLSMPLDFVDRPRIRVMRFR